MNNTCYLCGSQESFVIFQEHDVPILKCKSCTHVYSSYEQKEHYDGYWGEEETSEFDLEWWDQAHREIYEDFITRFLKPESGKILDVGCGLGYFVKTVSEKKPKWEVIGYEMSKTAVKFAKEKNGLTNVYAGMVQDSKMEPGSLDIITLWDVIEHIPKPQPLLDYLYTLLKPGGFLFVQTPNFPIQLWKARAKVLLKGMKPDVHYLEAKDHVNDYTRRTLTQLSLQCKYQKPEFYVMTPILSVVGSRSGFAVLAKKSFYHLTKWIWILSGRTLFLNNTLFAILRK